MSVRVVYRDPAGGGFGYHPVFHMVRLAAECLGGELVRLPRRNVGYLEKLFAILSRRQRTGPDVCLIVCASPADLDSLLSLDLWKFKYARIVPWIFDSFWVDEAPIFTRFSRHFDHVFVTEPEDVVQWRRQLSASVTCLPWGSDVLRLGSNNANRDIDLLRVGRQPSDWEDDARTKVACGRRGIAFQGRPERKEDATENQRFLTHTMGRAKFSLSFSNAVSPSIQTHPTREYITGRWLDAVASGTIVAGVAPKTELVDSVLWPEALLELTTTDLSKGLDVIEEALASWSPDRAALNHLRSLERLDWRWRFETIANVLGIRCNVLNSELSALRTKIDDEVQIIHNT